MMASTKPLTYCIDVSLADTPEVKALIAANADVVIDRSMVSDLIIGPNCFRMNRDTINLLAFAEQSARLAKYPPVPKKKKKGAS
jgi:hypothetical protein